MLKVDLIISAVTLTFWGVGVWLIFDNLPK
jgi:Na+-transporting methylmalonyl-CoA/oxaloacetate decarboxylase gamma subunit